MKIKIFCLEINFNLFHFSFICCAHNKLNYYTLNSLSLFWLAESVQWIFEISACDVITADYTIIMSRSHRNHVKVTNNHVVYDRGACQVRSFCLPSVKKHKHEFFLFRSMYNKTIIRFGFCDIQNNQGLGKAYQPLPRPWLFWISAITKTSSNNC